MIENVISLYRASGDCFFYVNGPSDENELLLLSVLSGLYETLSIILRYALFAPLLTVFAQCHLANFFFFVLGFFRGQIDKRMLLENFDAVLLTIDEMVDRGYAEGSGASRTRSLPIYTFLITNILFRLGLFSRLILR